MDLVQNVIIAMLVAYLAFRENEARRAASDLPARRRALLDRIGPPTPGEKPGRTLLRAHLAGKQ